MVEWKRDDFLPWLFLFVSHEFMKPRPPLCGVTQRWQDPIPTSLKWISCLSWACFSGEVEAECLNKMTLILLPQDPKLNSHLPLPGQGGCSRFPITCPCRIPAIPLGRGSARSCCSITAQKSFPWGYKSLDRGCLLPDYPEDDFCLSGQQLSLWGS